MANEPKPRWIVNRSDYPDTREKQTYRVARDGSEIVLSKRDRQALEALVIGPCFCASLTRLGDNVLRLRRDHGLDIKTERDVEYGPRFYRLNDDVYPIQGDS